MRNFFIGAILGIVLLFVILFIYYYSGMFNISTAASHPVIDSIMGTIRDRSIDYHAGKKLDVTEKNSDLKKGAADFMNTCVICHGAPGYEEKDFAKYIDPIATNLSDKDEIGDLSDAQIFWIIKNGIRMTAMPAFGEIESDANIQNDVLFVKKMQNLKKEDINKLLK